MPSLPKILTILTPSDLNISTWLTLGAILQCLLSAFLPLTLSLLPPLTFLLYLFTKTYLIAHGSLPNPSEANITYGRQTWQIPPSSNENNTIAESQTGSKESIVVLILCVSFTHPTGKFSPGSKEIGSYFNAMWTDVESNRELYGFLGNTPPLSTSDDGLRADSQGSQQMSISYWKTLSGLHKFAHGSAHMKGQIWWEKTAFKQFKHLGIMHEVYEVPKGNWENVFHNFRPFGISNAKYPVKKSLGDDGDDVGEVEWVSGLRPANGKNWKNMESRMGRREMFGSG